MKYCTKCGAELDDNAAFCSKCGHPCDPKVEAEPAPQQEVVEKKGIRKRDDSLMTVAFVFCVISTVLTGFAIIPLCWMIPLTVALYNRIHRKEPISIALKIVILLFVSLIGGIILLIGDESEDL